MRSPLESVVMIDKHFSAHFYAELLGVHPDTIIRWFQDEPGVLHLGEQNTRRRTRDELRIPMSVFLRIYQERTKGRAA